MTPEEIGGRPRSPHGPDDSRLSTTRIGLTYLWRHHRWPELSAPRRFTEWVQWRKLHERPACHTALMDKLAAKRKAEALLGRNWIIPTLWSGPSLPPAPAVCGPAILKARHGCNQWARLDPETIDADWAALSVRSQDWCAAPYGGWLDEWAYRDVPRGLLIEPFVSDDADLPRDYKIYVFGGRATHVQVHVGRGSQHRWYLHDRDFRPLVDDPDHDAKAARPQTLPAMLEAAETLASGEDFLRVDFYEVAGRPLFGEFCLYPGSGLDPFAAPWIDTMLGELWSEARRMSGQAAVAKASPSNAIIASDPASILRRSAPASGRKRSMK